MNFGHLILYFLFAIILFCLLNYLNKLEKDNGMISAIIPIIYIVFLAELFLSLNNFLIVDNLYLIIVFELLIRIYYVKVILSRDNLISMKDYTAIYFISIVGGYIINNSFLSKVTSVFPTANEMRPGIWLLIILFLYFTFKKHIHFNTKEQKSNFDTKKIEYALIQYVKLKTKYHKNIKLKEKDLNSLFYSIMIYENYRRPLFYRKLDRIIYRFTGREMKMGIMQISSREELEDIDSIKIACKNFDKIILELGKVSKKNRVNSILNEYYTNEDDIENVLKIHNAIVDFDEK